MEEVAQEKKGNKWASFRGHFAKITGSSRTVHCCGHVDGLKTTIIICSFISLQEKTAWNDALKVNTYTRLFDTDRHLVHSFNTSNAGQNRTAYILNINVLSKEKKAFSFYTHATVRPHPQNAQNNLTWMNFPIQVLVMVKMQHCNFKVKIYK